MIIESNVSIIVNPNSKKYYNSIGYECENFDKILVRTKDLTKGSNIEILVSCDICQYDRKLKYNRYYKNTKGLTILYTCKKCSSIKNKKTKFERYGDENYQNIDRIKKTKFERYGYENYTNRESAKKTCLEKYGVENVSQSDEIKEIKRGTNLKNWGVENVFQSEDVKTKISNTIMSKYGTYQYLLSEDYRNKYINFCNELGVDHYSQSDEFKEKFEKTCLLKWGVKTNLLSDETKSKIKISNIIKYGYDSHMKNSEFIYLFVKKIADGRSEYYKSLGYEMIEYDKDEREYTLKKIDCGHIFKIKHDLFRSRIKYGNNSCLECYPKDNISSIKESEIGDFIKTLSDNVILNSRDLIGGKEIDIYIPGKRLGVEFNGLYWHSDIFKSKSYHYDKTISCHDNDISLIHIWEDDWINKKDIVKSIIKNRLCTTSDKIYARKCKIGVVSNSISNKFLNENHIQGGTNASVCLSLTYNGDIVSIMTFGSRRMNSILTFELIRFCNIINTTVVGGASRIFKYFIKNYDHNEIISYSDVSMFDGGLYENLGFKNDGKTSLNYYWTDLFKRYHRFNFNKKKLIKMGYDPNMTEDSIMRSIGYYKIWSCGQIRWVYKNEVIGFNI